MEHFVGTAKKTKTVVLDYDSDYENTLYKAGVEYTVDENTAKRLLEINEVLKRENR